MSGESFGISPKKYGYTVAVPHGWAEEAELAQREFGIALGLIKISDEERAERERRRLEHREREARYAAAVVEWAASITEPHWQAVLALHSRTDSGYCDGCEPGMYAEDGIYWPCATVELVAEQTGKPIPDA